MCFNVFSIRVGLFYKSFYCCLFFFPKQLTLFFFHAGKSWKRMITKHTFVGENFTRKPPKFERFIRPMALRSKKAHVTHPELKATFSLPIIGVKKNPNSPLFTQLGVLTKGTIIEVNVSELGLVTQGGKVVWGKYAQVTNHPENDGCINAVLLV
jgi:ribosome biogenesis protein NSA2